MKRDMDLTRLILLKIEEFPGVSFEGYLEIEGREQEEISFHIMLLCEAGLLVATDVSSNQDCVFIPSRLTWDGYEFLDAARDNAIWKEAKRTIGSKVASVSFSILQQILLSLLSQQFGLA